MADFGFVVEPTPAPVRPCFMLWWHLRHHHFVPHTSLIPVSRRVSISALRFHKRLPIFLGIVFNRILKCVMDFNVASVPAALGCIASRINQWRVQY
jgi:hypothetical protein